MENHAVLTYFCGLLCSVEEGNYLTASAGSIRREAIAAGSHGYAIADSPIHGIIHYKRNLGNNIFTE